MMANTTTLDKSKITTLIFDVDDTLYDVGTGFTAHRNGEGATSFMVAKLNFPDLASAKVVRDEYFVQYHSTAKALCVAEEEGRFPPQIDENGNESGNECNNENDKKGGTTIFDTKDLAEWWATKLNFSLLGKPNPKIIQMLESCPLNLVAFSNGPRLYVLRTLKELGLDKCFPPNKVFAVDDVLPCCKPEAKAFEKVLSKIGVKDPSECIMVEDSMKNIRAAKELGMATVLIAGLGRMRKDKGVSVDGNDDADAKDKKAQELADQAEATKAGDAPDASDDAVDVCIESVAELESALPELWK